ncbi:MFS transporter [Caulobacter sp.]|uniref:MFS transporter n=1 Tax=Caulobacter sp. TaxID=78 RepID=UPI003D110EA8
MASALFMEFIDATALSTALPTLARAFAVDPIHLKLALTSYILALAVFTPVSGWAAERFGARRVFLAAMTVFLLGSALCGLSRDLEALVTSRIVQGLGGAMMTPVARLIVVGSTPKDKLISAMGWFTVPALLGPLLGPPLAGLVLTFADWPWIFYLNLPVGVLGMAAVMRFVPKGLPPPRHPLRLGGLHPVGHGDQRPGGGGRDLGPEPAALARAAVDPGPGPGVRLGLSAPRQALTQAHP